jgi:hypothetical protein
MTKLNVIGVDLAKNVIQISVLSRSNREHLATPPNRPASSGLKEFPAPMTDYCLFLTLFTIRSVRYRPAARSDQTRPEAARKSAE